MPLSTASNAFKRFGISIDDKLKLADDFTYLRDEDVALRGLTYAEVAQRHPAIKARFDGTRLDIVTINTSEIDEIDVIEDLFSRLNEAVPLNAPEETECVRGAVAAADSRRREQSVFC